MLATCACFFLVGLPFCTRLGNELLDVVDHYAVSYFLLFGCFLEAVMFALDVGWQRIAAALRLATAGNPSTPNGRFLAPHPLFWRGCLYVTVPVFTLFLFVQLWVTDLQSPYQGYPDGLQAVGWTLLAILLVITPLTLPQRAAGSLPTLTRRHPNRPSEVLGTDQPL